MISTYSYSLRPLLLSVCFAFPVLAVAGGVAEIETGRANERVRATLEFDGSNLRVTPADGTGPEGVDGYLVFRDGQGYSVANANGRLVVMEMGDAIKMLTGIAGQQGAAGIAFDDVGTYHGLTALGVTETVAGVRGEVYRMDYESQNGLRESRDVVLSSDPLAREMTETALTFGTAVAVAMDIPEPQGSQQVKAELRRQNAGVLRFGDEFRVISLSSNTPTAERFDLPAGALQIPTLPEGFSLPGVGGGTDGEGGNSVNEMIDRAYRSIFGGGN